MGLIRRKVRPTPHMLAAEAAQKEAARRRVEADRSGERFGALASVLGRHLETNSFAPRIEAALTIGRRER